MVSMADEQGRLVLVGVDATYCVVDEVDTTSSLTDHFLQEAIDDADTKANVKVELAAHNRKNGVGNHFIRKAIKKTAEKVIRNSDLTLRGKSGPKKPENLSTKPATNQQKRKSSKGGEKKQKNSQAEDHVDDPLASNDQSDLETTNHSVSNSSLLRAVLLCQPVSLREPGKSSGRLSFCQQEGGSSEEDTANTIKNVTSGTGEESQESTRKGDDVNSVKARLTPPRRKIASPKKACPLKPLKPKPPATAEAPVLETAKDTEPAAGDKEVEAEGEEEEVKPKPKRSREKPYQCGVCSRWFGCKSHVVEHMRTHTGEKPFQCTLCDKRFSQKSNIYQHMNTHTKERPFRCNDCGKDFMYRGSLYKHKRLHTGERPYTCGLCSRRFTHASQLFEHLRTHTNERPFKCGVCGRAFAHSGTMHRHQRNHFSQVNNNNNRSKKIKQTSHDEAKEEMEEETGEGDGTQGIKGKELREDINHNLEAYSPPVANECENKETDVGSGNGVDASLDCGSAGDGWDEKSVPPKVMLHVSDSSNNNSKVISLETGHAFSNKTKNKKVTSLDGNDILNNNTLSSSEAASDLTGSAAVMDSEENLVIADRKAERKSPRLSSSAQSESLDNNTKSQDKETNSLQNTPQRSSTRGGASCRSSLKRKAKTPDKTSPTSKRKSKDSIEEDDATTGKKTKRTRIETPDRKVFSCSLCGHSFCHKRSVKRHKQAMHPDATDDDDDVAAKVTGAQRETSTKEKQQENGGEDGGEEEEESKEELRLQLTNSSLLKSLLTMTAAGYAQPATVSQSGSYVFPDLAALGVRPLGEASANLHAFAQLCSQETEALGNNWQHSSPSTTQSESAAHSVSIPSSADNTLSLLHVKVEPESDEQLMTSQDGAEQGQDIELPTGDVAAAAVAAAAAAMQRVVVKTEPVDMGSNG